MALFSVLLLSLLNYREVRPHTSMSLWSEIYDIFNTKKTIYVMNTWETTKQLSERNPHFYARVFILILEVIIALDFICLDCLCFFDSSTTYFFLPVDISDVSIIVVLLGTLLVQTCLSSAIHAQDFVVVFLGSIRMGFWGWCATKDCG